MEIWIVILPFSTDVLSDYVCHYAILWTHSLKVEQTYSQCLKQLDGSSQARVKRFYHREDAWRK